MSTHDSQYPQWPVNGEPFNTFGVWKLSSRNRVTLVSIQDGV